MIRVVQLAAAASLIAIATTPASAHTTEPKLKPKPPVQQVLAPGEMSAEMKATLFKLGWPNLPK